MATLVDPKVIMQVKHYMRLGGVVPADDMTLFLAATGDVIRPLEGTRVLDLTR